MNIESSSGLIVKTVPSKRGPAPVKNTDPQGPVIQESLGIVSPARTYQDLLSSPYDEDLFSYYMTSQVLHVNLKGKVKNAVSNWGDFINWYVTPAGLWGEYSYLPDVAMIAGIPGHEYSSAYQDWEQSDMSTYYSDWYTEHGNELEVWCSELSLIHI